MIVCSVFDSLFGCVFDGSAALVEVSLYLLCMGVGLALGIFIAFMQTFQERSSRSLLVTLALMPMIISMIIMMVNGNIGTGIAIAGAFTLVRFRSQPATAKELSAIFIGMASGLAIGMGYLGFAVLFVIIVTPFQFILSKIGFGKRRDFLKVLRITVPEDLDYEGMFTDIFEKYTDEHRLTVAKTTNMGSMFRLTYELRLKSTASEKAMIDDIRCRNGNLEVMISQQTNESEI